jgi:hypothetical protein
MRAIMRGREARIDPIHPDTSPMHPTHPTRRPRATALAVLLTGALIALVPAAPEAGAFGTINGLGQSAEHEKITRASVACAAIPAIGNCFQPVSTRNLAGRNGTLGAVGAPDGGANFFTDWHCDDGDFLAGGYPRTRAQATAELLACRAFMQKEFGKAITESARLVDVNNRIVAREVDLTRPCTFVIPLGGRAKCDVYQAFGRVLHAGQDFYSHSNYSDVADPRQPIGIDNPPGLGLRGASPFLSLTGPAPAVPFTLATGCFSLIPVVGCLGRIDHDALNKDTGQISPFTGKAGRGTTARGKIGLNFQAAVSGAIAETRRQWNDLAKALVTAYGATRGSLMICALTRDDPIRDCLTVLEIPYPITHPPRVITDLQLEGAGAAALPPGGAG